MTTWRSIAFAALMSGVIPAPTPARAQAASDSALGELRQRLQTLQQQLDELGSARDAATQQRLLQQNWRGLQDYMGWMHDRFNVGTPWMVGHQGVGCCAMMGGRSGTAWSLPQGLTPSQFGQQMRDNLQIMQRQLTIIAQSGSPQERQRLLQDHWLTMYQRMQTMRGMGWMWAGPTRRGMMWRPMPGVATAEPLPESSSRGAALIVTFCTQCHAAPSPSLHTAPEWVAVTSRMRLNMSRVPGVRTPTTEEMRLILTYMQQHAR